MVHLIFWLKKILRNFEVIPIPPDKLEVIPIPIPLQN